MRFRASRRSAGSAQLRVVTARVSRDRLVLHAEVLGGDGVRVPERLLLAEHGSGREVVVQLSSQGSGWTIDIAVEVARLVSGGDPVTWELCAVSDGDEAAASIPVLSTLDAKLTPSAFVRQGQRLEQVRPRTAPSGRLELAVEPVPPHAEVQHVLVEHDVLAVEADLSRLPAPPPGTTAGLVATSRERHREVCVPAVLDGSSVRAELSFDALDTDVVGTEYWDLDLRIDGTGTLRFARHLDGVADKKAAYVFPPAALPMTSGSRSLQPYYTVNNGLSVRSQPVLPPSAPAQAAPTVPGPAQQATGKSYTRLEGRLLEFLRPYARPVARRVIRRLPARRQIPPVGRGRPRISILIVHGYGMGGTVRTVFNQADYLRRRYDVEIVSLFRNRAVPFFPLPTGVTLTPLDDRTESGRRRWPLRVVQNRLSRMPSLLVHEADGSYPSCSLWTDVQLVRRLRAQQGGILMGTRPSLNLLAAQLAAPEVITVGQEHMNFLQHKRVLARALHRAFRRLDALTVLTHGDLEDYTRTLSGSGTEVVRIPNSLTPLTGGQADPGSKVVVAAGRLTRQKGFDLLIAAFDQVVRAHPDWTLRIYGSGPHRRRLQDLIVERGLSNNVLLMGRADRMGDELAQGSVYVLSSRFEGFGMVIIEAMSKGLAVISFDCPRGPADLITHGVDGMLVPEKDVDALAHTMLEVIKDRDLRGRLAAAALESVHRYDADVVGRQWDDLFDRLLSQRAPSWWQPGWTP